MRLLSTDEFAQHVESALGELSPEIRQMIDNVIIAVEDQNEEEPEILGLYEGLPLTERDGYGLMELPDQISIYRLPLCAMCEDITCLLYTSPSPRDQRGSRMPSSA